MLLDALVPSVSAKHQVTKATFDSSFIVVRAELITRYGEQMNILNSIGIEHFKAQCWLFAFLVADKHAEMEVESDKRYELSPKQKISLLPVKLTTIYNEWSKSAGFKSFSDMKAHSNEATGRSVLHLQLLEPTDLLKGLMVKYAPSHELYNPVTDKSQLLNTHELLEEEHDFLCEYLYYSDPEIIISSETHTMPDGTYVTDYLAWTRGDLSAGVYSSVYLDGDSVESLEVKAKSELIESIKSFADWV